MTQYPTISVIQWYRAKSDPVHENDLEYPPYGKAYVRI